MAVSDPDLIDLRSGATTMFTGFASVWTRPMILHEKEGTSELINAATVTTNFFQLLGATVALGRDFVESDDQPFVFGCYSKIDHSHAHRRGRFPSPHRLRERGQSLIDTD
jgi:hypothetical protein